MPLCGSQLSGVLSTWGKLFPYGSKLKITQISSELNPTYRSL